MKRWTALTLTLLSLAAFSGCGSDEPTEDMNGDGVIDEQDAMDYAEPTTEGPTTAPMSDGPTGNPPTADAPTE